MGLRDEVAIVICWTDVPRVKLPSEMNPGGIFANNGLARAQSHAHAYYPWFSMRVDKAMSTENLLMVTVMRTAIALIFFAHDLSHRHTENFLFAIDNFEMINRGCCRELIFNKQYLLLLWFVRNSPSIDCLSLERWQCYPIINPATGFLLLVSKS